ncbi:unnamed protein product [Candidula unifasciata]|uniref:Uncharacterized protein n=1 Tax=Candidula unifasciata TaxID=100452 RepID=A0A8S3Z943_9EUPU|nr:unnamed protein product [Candidula unifasciata]
MQVIGTDNYMPLLLSFLRRAANMAEGQVKAYTSGTASMAFVTVPNIEIGRRLAHGLVEQKLAACVNIIPQVTSVYTWQGKINEDSELILMIKTLTSRIDDVSEFVRKNHPYECAEVISSKIDNGNPPYLKWILDTVSDKTEPSV